MPAIKNLMDEVMSGPSEKDRPRRPARRRVQNMLANAKKLTLFAAGAATQKYMQQIADEQEVMGAIADMIIEVFAMESAILRAEKIAARPGRRSSRSAHRHGPHLRRQSDVARSNSPRAKSSPRSPKETCCAPNSPSSAASPSTTQRTPSPSAARSQKP